MSTSQFAVYQLKKKPELRNLLFRTYEELAKDQISVQMENYEQVYLGTMKPGETPEQIKKELEKKQPHNYKGHAVSTSDVLILNDEGVMTTYYVNKDTFIEIPDFMKVTSSESGGLTKDAEHPEAFEDMEESEEDRLFEKINEAIWAGDVETIKKCFPQIDKNDKQIQAELTWIVAKDVMKNRELRELYFQKYGVKYKVRKEKRRNS